MHVAVNGREWLVIATEGAPLIIVIEAECALKGIVVKGALITLVLFDGARKFVLFTFILICCAATTRNGEAEKKQRFQFLSSYVSHKLSRYSNETSLLRRCCTCHYARK